MALYAFAFRSSCFGSCADFRRLIACGFSTWLFLAVCSLGGFFRRWLFGRGSPLVGFPFWAWFRLVWVSCFGYGSPVVVLPAFDALPVRSSLFLCFHCFGGCSFGWVFLFSACGVACCPSWVSVRLFPCCLCSLIFVRFVCRGSMALYFARFRLFLLSSVKYKCLPVFGLFRLLPACVLFAVFKVLWVFIFAHLGRLYNVV